MINPYDPPLTEPEPPPAKPGWIRSYGDYLDEAIMSLILGDLGALPPVLLAIVVVLSLLLAVISMLQQLVLQLYS